MQSMHDKPKWMGDHHRYIGGVDNLFTVWALDRRRGVDYWDVILGFGNEHYLWLDLFISKSSDLQIRAAQISKSNEFFGNNLITDEQRYRALLMVKLFASNLWKEKSLPPEVAAFMKRMEKETTE